MSWSRLVLVPLVLAALVSPASAGIFTRKTKPSPTERVPELLLQLQTSQDEVQRTAAAEELRQYEAKEFPKIIPALIDALNRDASPAVRAEAANSLGKLRPISQQAGYALEQSQNTDAAMRVRLAARQSLWQYHLVGYRGGNSPDGATADGASTQQPGAVSRSGQSSHAPGRIRETAEPPLATTTNPVTANPVSRERLSNPPRVTPANRPRETPAVPPTPADGPALPPE
jgi:hypothetical protein